MSDKPDNKPRMPLAFVVLGGGALLLAAAVDTVAVIGRHVGFPFVGAIELVEASVLVAGSVAIVAATLARSHAVVRLVQDRVSPRAATVLSVIHRLFSAIFFIGLVVGSVWLAADLWPGHEESEFLKISYKPLRIICIAGLLAVALLFLKQAIRGERE